MNQETLLSRARAFRRDDSGAAVVIFGLALVPLVLIAGGAIEYSATTRAEGQLQRSLDAGVIAAARAGKDDATLVERFVRENMPRGANISGVTVSKKAGPTAETEIFVADVRLQAPTNLLRLARIENVRISAHSEALVAKRVMTASFRPQSAKGIYSKDIFIWTKDQNGNVTSKQVVLTYRYNPVAFTPPIGNWSTTFVVPPYSSYGVGMTVYADDSWQGQLINMNERWSDAPNAADFTHRSGNCAEGSNGEHVEMEDGGDSDFTDLVYDMRCAYGLDTAKSARLIK